MKKVVRFRESCDCTDALISSNTIRDVKNLGLSSANRRRYLPEAVRQAVGLYENARVFCDHPSSGNPTAVRSVRDYLGRLANVRIDEDGGLRGDLIFNPANSLAKEVEWLAKNDPGSVGLSHNCLAQSETRNGVFEVSKIINLRSVDLVTSPASTRSLYEAHMRRKRTREGADLSDLDDRLDDRLDLDDEGDELDDFGDDDEADKAGVLRGAVARWERGDREPGWSNILALCQALGVSCEAFTEEPTTQAPSGPGRPRKADYGDQEIAAHTIKDETVGEPKEALSKPATGRTAQGKG